MGPSFSWLGRQIVNLEVAGSNPVGPAIFPYVNLTPGESCEYFLAGYEQIWHTGMSSSSYV